LKIAHTPRIQFVAQPAQAPVLQIGGHPLQNTGRPIGFGEGHLQGNDSETLVCVIHEPAVSEDFELQIGLMRFADFLKLASPLRARMDFFYEDENLCSWLA
jgi:hypothetical protein